MEIKIPTIVQANGNRKYINIPAKISEATELEKGETAIVSVKDKDTIVIKLVEG